jgi:hypothetical protein|tara:strand:+ start:402 stop:602 length:201 start_codon:yes stop_codon:yes gene_type:complete
MRAKKGPRVKQLLKELESGKHKSKGIEPPNMGAMRALLAVARKNTHKPHKYKNLVKQKARGYAGRK